MVSSKWIFDFPVTLNVVVLGLIGNVLSIIVWNRLKKKTCSNNASSFTYFITLARIDICVLVATLFVDVIPAMTTTLPQSSYLYSVFFIYIAHPARSYFTFCSVYLTTALVIDRLRLVLRPNARLTKVNITITISIVFVFAIAFGLNIPSFFDYRLKSGNVSHYTEAIPISDNIKLRNIKFYSHCVVGIFVPWIIMLTCNVILIITLFQKHHVYSENTERLNNEHRNISINLLSVTFSTLLLLGYQCISRCITMFVTENHPQWSSIKLAADVGNVAVPINSAVNFIMYSFSGQLFRTELILFIKTTRISNQISTTSSVSDEESTITNHAEKLTNNHPKIIISGPVSSTNTTYFIFRVQGNQVKPDVDLVS